MHRACDSVAIGGTWKYNSAGLNWVAAEASCRACGGHLASVHGPDEETEMLEWIAEVAPSSTQPFWIGGNDLGAEVRCSASLFFLF